MSNKIKFGLLILIVLLSRVPFLEAGYGSDPDSWRVAGAAIEMNETHQYSVSRFPGYPLQEITSSFFVQYGPAGLNGLTALFSILSVIFFLMIIRKIGRPDYFLLGILFAFTPVVYLNSINSMDYIWALSFILGSVYFALEGKPVPGGIFLGLAIGCRMTSVLMIFPIALYFLNYKEDQRLKDIVKFSLLAGGVAILAFLPVFLRYSTEMFTAYANGYPSFKTVLIRSTVSVWGKLGFIVIIASVLIKFIKVFISKTENLNLSMPDKKIMKGIYLTIVLYALLFISLPHEAGYWIVTLPFVILLFSVFFKKKYLLAITMAVILSSFIKVRTTEITFEGAVLNEQKNRKEDVRFVNAVIKASREISGKAVIVSGWWLPKIEVLISGREKREIEFVYILKEKEAEDKIVNGFNLFYIPEMLEFNKSAAGTDLNEYKAKPLLNQALSYK